MKPASNEREASPDGQLAGRGDRRSELTLEEIPTDASARELVRGFVPTPRFARVSFDSYRPDRAQPSQREAVETVRAWIGEAAREAERSDRRRGRLRSILRRGVRRAASAAGPQALYLDGGFGVGKTHLLAAAYHVGPAPKAYLSFAELTYLVGAMGMDACVDAFRTYRLICIDEFELDDVANTRLAATFLRRVFEGSDRPVRVLTTSNTVPTELGRGRFAADDFKREIGEIAAAFEVVRIEGEDFRRRTRSASESPPATPSGEQLRRAHAAWVPEQKAKLFTDFPALTRRLSRGHPIRYAKLVEPLEAVFVDGVEPIEDQEMALRFVHFIDKVYDQDVRFAFSATCELSDIFSPEYRDKGYRKKYRRCLSRLHELTAEWNEIREGRRTA